MSQHDVEHVIGRAATDTAFRQALIDNAREAVIEGQAQAMMFQYAIAPTGHTITANPAAPTPQQFATCRPVAVASATKAPAGWQDGYAARQPAASVETYGVSGRIDHKALAFEVVAQHGDERRLVLDDQDQRLHRMPARSGATTWMLELSPFGRACVSGVPCTR